MRKNLYQKICEICPLCKYTRSRKNSGWKYHLLKKIESICIICKLAKMKKKKGGKEKTMLKMKNEFENRYPSHLPMPCRDGRQLGRTDAFTSSFELIDYYKKILMTEERLQELSNLRKSNNKKIIGIFCNFVPEELLHACDAVPVRLCAGCCETISAAEEVLPRDICPLIKSSFGFKMLEWSYFSFCDLVIIPTTCDGKMKLGEILNNYLPVYIFELPHKKNIEKICSLVEEIKKLKTKLELFTGKKITRKKLKNAVLLLQKRNSVFRRLYNLRKSTVLSGRDSFLIVQASFYDDIHRWIQNTKILCDYLENQSLTTNRHLPKLLLTGAPIIWPNFKLLNIIEDTGAIIVADDHCSGTQYLYNTAEIDDWTEKSILKAIAIKYFLPSICPCFVESNDRIDRILNLVKEFKVDGVIHHSLRLCQLYDIELYRIREVLRDKKIHFLSIHTDYSQEDVEQIKIRVEAFLEMLKK